MPEIGLFYGSNEGNTTEVCFRVKGMFDIIEPNLVQLINIGEVGDPKELEKWDYIIISCPTWNIGELQDDWAEFYPKMDNLDLTGKKVALFGLGDQFGYSSSFIDAVGILGKKCKEKGAEIVGYWARGDYEFESSAALDGDKLMGLGIDQDNEPHKTEDRLVKWIIEDVEPHFRK